MKALSQQDLVQWHVVTDGCRGGNLAVSIHRNYIAGVLLTATRIITSDALLETPSVTFV